VTKHAQSPQGSRLFQQKKILKQRETQCMVRQEPDGQRHESQSYPPGVLFFLMCLILLLSLSCLPFKSQHLPASLLLGARWRPLLWGPGAAPLLPPAGFACLDFLNCCALLAANSCCRRWISKSLSLEEEGAAAATATASGEGERVGAGLLPSGEALRALFRDSCCRMPSMEVICCWSCWRAGVLKAAVCTKSSRRSCCCTWFDVPEMSLPCAARSSLNSAAWRSRMVRKPFTSPPTCM